ncbi:hypothetical protein JW935_13725 [candidate division KSB1 bacterium]|nr:hypothetical protein [candidate division KSB1 bacterium]
MNADGTGTIQLNRIFYLVKWGPTWNPMVLQAARQGVLISPHADSCGRQETRQVRFSVNSQVSPSITIAPLTAFSITAVPLTGSYFISTYGVCANHHSRKFHNSVMANMNISQKTQTTVLTGSSG